MAKKKEKEAGTAECGDRHCPVHGQNNPRGSVLVGEVVSDKGKKTAIVERHFLKYVPKFERFERRKSRIPVHNPPCIRAKAGDKVRIAECRKLSKTKAWVVIEKLEAKQ